MVNLLDINILIALVDKEHEAHLKVRAWFSTNKNSGFATCSVTELGFVRVVLNPKYPHPFDPLPVLHSVHSHQNWVWWDDGCSPGDYLISECVSTKQITALHLLALAVHHSGVLVTLDQKIAYSCVRNATARTILTL